MKVSEIPSKTASSLKSLLKVCLQSRRSSITREYSGTLIIMGNGPSLNNTIATELETLKQSVTMSVNFAPNASEFFLIKPRFHVLADPLFFADNKPENVNRLYENLQKADWRLTLFVPAKYVRHLPEFILSNANIAVRTFNFVGAEGFRCLENMLFSRRLAMPRPRNVLVPAIMCGIWEGFEEMYIVGADHSWMQTISVDENNCVISVQPHFYKDEKTEQQRVDTTYRNYRLHDIVESFAIAFRSYHSVRRYADGRNVAIYNATPGSFIDAFERKKLPAVKS